MARSFSVEAVLSAKDNASGVFNKVAGSVGGLSKALRFAAVGAAALLVVAFVKLIGVMQRFAAEAGKAELATARLEGAQRSAGIFTVKAAKDLDDFSLSLDKSTGATQSQAKELLALAIAFTKSNEQAKDLTAAALDFAEGAGINMEEALRRLGRATQGSTDDVAKFAPAIRNMTREQLRAGEATAAIAEAFKGRAAAALNTYAGALKEVEDAQKRFGEALGRTVIGGDGVTGSITLQAQAWDRLANAVDRENGPFAAILRSWENLKLLGIVVAARIAEVGQNSSEAAQKELELAEASKKAELALKDEARVLDTIEEVLNTFTDEVDTHIKSREILLRLKEREARLDKEVADGADRQREILESLGLRAIPQLKTALADVNDQMEFLDRRFELGDIGAKVFQQAMADLRIEAEAIQAVINGTATSVDAYKEALALAEDQTNNSIAATDLLEGSTIALRDATDRVGLSLDKTTGKLRTAAGQARITGAAFDAISRSQGRAAAVAASNPADIFLGGTRVRVPGGSRLTSPPGFSTNTRSSIPIGGPTLAQRAAARAAAGE